MNCAKSEIPEHETWIVIERPPHIFQSNVVDETSEKFPHLVKNLNCTKLPRIKTISEEYAKAKEELAQIHKTSRQTELNHNSKEVNILTDTQTSVILNEVNFPIKVQQNKEELTLNNRQRNILENDKNTAILENNEKICKMVVKSKHLIFSYDETKGYYLCFPLAKLIWCTITLPFFAFIFCVVWSILYNFEETTFTHCKVWNFLPSISAAIGNHTTQYWVWVTAVTLHAGPRFLFVSIYYRYYLKLVKHQKQYLARVACSLNVIENFSLLGLTYLSSSNSYEIHEKCFITFMASSELYMLLTCMIFTYHRKTASMDKYETFSLRMKTRLLIVNAISFSTAGYFFLRHNKYCEPGIYTLFAFFEYIVVLSNMAFHLTALFDFKDQCITVYKKGIDVR